MPDGTTTPKTETLPATVSTNPLAAYAASPAMAIWFDDRLFDRARLIAKYLSEAEGFIPKHLIGKPQACFAVVERSLTWHLSPYAVAASTYETPGGKVGFEGKLCQAILENSGKLEGGVKFEHYGEWDKVKGKYEIKKGNTGKEYAARTWGREDAKGLGVIVRAKVKGEAEPRELDFELDEAFPLNSTLWATSPKRQICYAAVRAFANIAAPGLFMGVPFDYDGDAAAPFARDVTPAPARPTRDDFLANRPAEGHGTPAEAVTDTFPVMTAEGEAVNYTDPEEAADALMKELDAAQTEAACDGIWESNTALLNALRDHGHDGIADGLGDYGSRRTAALRAAGQAKAVAANAAPAESEKKAEPKPEPAAEQRQADPAKEPEQKPAAAEKSVSERLAETHAPSGDDRFWSGESLRIDLKRRGPNAYYTLGWANDMAKRIREAPSLNQLDRLDADNHAEWSLMKQHAKPGHDSLQTAVQQRRGELGG